jgi:hypothetical protein
MNYPVAEQRGIYKGIVTPHSSGELISLGLINPCPPQVGLSASGGIKPYKHAIEKIKEKYPRAVNKNGP